MTTPETTRLTSALERGRERVALAVRASDWPEVAALAGMMAVLEGELARLQAPPVATKAGVRVRARG